MGVQRLRDELVKTIEGPILLDEPMSAHTTWKIGGPADIFLIPKGIKDCLKAVNLAKENNVPYIVIGNGSNILVKDKGIRGLVIKMSGGMTEVFCEGQIITAQAGALLPSVARLAVDNDLTGLEFAVGIPASVGGAVIMNAGAHGSSMSEVVKEVRFLTSDGEQKTYSENKLNFSYRSSNLKSRNIIVTQVSFALQQSSQEEISQQMKEYARMRKERQPAGKPNAGSVFKNPPDVPAGKLIEDAGCKGMMHGGAVVSEKHANFILNADKASANDVLQLMEIVRQKVYNEAGVLLETEIQVIGE